MAVYQRLRLSEESWRTISDGYVPVQKDPPIAFIYAQLKMKDNASSVMAGSVEVNEADTCSSAEAVENNCVSVNQAIIQTCEVGT